MIRNILGISGGKDSTALAVYMSREFPNLNIEYFFCDTGAELKETYEYLEKIEKVLGIKIVRLKPKLDMHEFLDKHGYYLPSFRSRWCTNEMKIRPMLRWIGKDDCISYVGLRYDEKDRTGFNCKNGNVKTVYPFVLKKMVEDDIIKLLNDSGLGMPEYYKWRSRSGCYFCFYQRPSEWARLHNEHPDLFARAKWIEEQGKYTWHGKYSLQDILDKKDKIIARAERKEERNRLKKIKDREERIDTSKIYDDDGDILDIHSCMTCHL